MPRGRPKIEIDLVEVERLAGLGLSQEQIADCLGIGEKTFRRRKKDSDLFDQAVKRGQAKGVRTVTNALYDQAVNEGSVPAAIFYLKNRAGWSDRHEHTGEGGGPIKTETKVLNVVGVKGNAGSDS